MLILVSLFGSSATGPLCVWWWTGPQRSVYQVLMAGVEYCTCRQVPSGVAVVVGGGGGESSRDRWSISRTTCFLNSAGHECKVVCEVNEGKTGGRSSTRHNKKKGATSPTK